MCATHEKSPGRVTAPAMVPLHPIHPWKTSETRVLQLYRWQTQQENSSTREKRSATCPRKNSCEHDQLLRHQIRERRKLEKLPYAFPCSLRSSGILRSRPRRRSRTARRVSFCSHPSTTLFVFWNADKAAVHLASPEGALAGSPRETLTGGCGRQRNRVPRHCGMAKVHS